MMNVEDIKPYPKNAKTHSKKQIKQIANSIQEFGFNQPIVVDKEGIIIVGHGRFEAAKHLDLREVPVVTVNLTEEKAKAYRLADNRLNESPWEMELVIEELRTMGEGMYRMTGFDMDLIVDPSANDDVLPELAPPRAKSGDIYALGDHRIVCGDACNPQTIRRILVGGEKAAMTFTDPPYNVNYTGGPSKKHKVIANDKMTTEEFGQFLQKALKNIVDHTAGGIYVCMSPKEIGTAKREFERAGAYWASTIIWVKNNFVLSGSDYHPTYEPILYGWAAKTKKHYFVDRRDSANVWEELASVKAEYDGTYTTISFQGFKVKVPGKVERGSVIRKKQRLDIFRHDKPSKSIEHSTMKPVSLITEAICNSSKEKDIVLDPFLGSGSTLIAAEKTGRICYGVEIDPHHVDTSIARWEEFTKLKAKKL